MHKKLPLHRTRGCSEKCRDCSQALPQPLSVSCSPVMFFCFCAHALQSNLLLPKLHARTTGRLGVMISTTSTRACKAACLASSKLITPRSSLLRILNRTLAPGNAQTAAAAAAAAGCLDWAVPTNNHKQLDVTLHGVACLALWRGRQDTAGSTTRCNMA